MVLTDRACETDDNQRCVLDPSERVEWGSAAGCEVSEISRTDHVAVGNAVPDSPRTYLPRRPRSQRGAYEESKQVRGVNHEPPGPHCSTRDQRKGGVAPRE